MATAAIVIGLVGVLSAQARTPEERLGDRSGHAERRAKTSTASQCAAAKLDASGAYAEAVLDCRARAVSNAGSATDVCLRQAERELAESFAAQERTGACAATGEAVTFLALANPALADLLASLGGPSPDRCTRHKLRAAGESARAKYECQADAVAQGAGFGLAPACWALAEDGLADAFRRAERPGDCAAGTAEASTINDRIDRLVLKGRGLLSPPVSSCAPVEVTTLHGTNFHGNTRLARIEGGTVPCMQIDDGTVATCQFSVAGARVSGEWLESPEGNFAKTGQAISLAGAPGGDYVVAARVSDTAGAPCIEPTGMDTAGWVAEGNDLIGSCVVEELSMEWNAMSSYGYFPLVNYADGEVCSANDPAVHPHPDGARFVRTVRGSDGRDAFCYTGGGAALNDINGMERDETTNYRSGDGYCHLIVSSGYEVPGAKRPATRSLPAPGQVNTNSFIVWRPVNPNVNIANFQPAAPPLESFDDKVAFLEATGAEAATGELPDLGLVSGSVQIGSVTFAPAPGGADIAIGAAGTPAAPDWYPETPGNDIAMGYENLQVSLATPVYALGFDMVEPITTMPAYGGTPVDSTYQITLFSGTARVGSLTFNVPDDVQAFVGVRSRAPFDRAWIVDVTRDATGAASPFIDDDEYFGQFYTATTPTGALSRTSGR